MIFLVWYHQSFAYKNCLNEFSIDTFLFLTIDLIDVFIQLVGVIIFFSLQLHLLKEQNKKKINKNYSAQLLVQLILVVIIILFNNHFINQNETFKETFVKRSIHTINTERDPFQFCLICYSYIIILNSERTYLHIHIYYIKSLQYQTYRISNL